MIQKNILWSFLFIFLSSTSISFVMPEKDKLGRTPLMNYIIEQEKIYKTIQNQRKEIQASSKPYDIKQKDLRIQETNLKVWFKTTCDIILSMIEEEVILDMKKDDNGRIIYKESEIINHGPEMLSEKDNEGNTAINFTTSVDLYNFLRKKGAPFQFTQWLNHMTVTDALEIIANLSILGWGLSFVVAPEHTATLNKTYLYSKIGSIVSSGYGTSTKL
jgi:hypothetical protein